MSCTELAITEAGDKATTRKDMALTYALGLRDFPGVDWAAINAAILKRWSKSGLIWIKTQAWKLYESQKVAR